jgi:hypothetical protein
VLLHYIVVSVHRFDVSIAFLFYIMFFCVMDVAKCSTVVIVRKKKNTTKKQKFKLTDKADDELRSPILA